MANACQYDFLATEYACCYCCNSIEQSKNYLLETERDAETLTLTLDAFTKNTRTDQETLTMLSSSLNAISPIHQEISALLQSGETEAAHSLYTSQYVPMFEKSNDILLGIAEQQIQRADEQSVIADSAAASGRTILIATAVLAILIVIVVMTVLRKAILSPVNELNKVASAIAKGDLSATISYDSKDEFGQLANEFKGLLATVVGIIEDLDRGLAEIGKGNFAIESNAKALYKGDFSSLYTSMENIIQQLSYTLSQINEAALQVSSGSDQVSSGAQALSQGATEQASSIEELSISIAEVTGQIRQNADNAKLANERAE